MSATPRCQTFRDPSDLPPAFWNALKKNEPAANIILPFAKKASAHPGEVGNDQLWIIIYNIAGNDIEFVLSCTSGILGNYPIFVFTPQSSAQLARDEEEGKNVVDSLSQLVRCLLQQVPSKRIFSVFSVVYVAEKIAAILNEEHGIQPCEEPRYDATFTFCNSATLSKSSVFCSLPQSEDILIALRPAEISHLNDVTALCKGFAVTSPPYTLDDQQAEIEARALIINQQVWVHMIKQGDGDWETACLVATTRQSENVTAVTKVFTANRWRSRGCAARLLHRVCQEILRKKERVVLYVGNGEDLAPARKVYHKIGFQGLNAQQEQQVEGVERWLEIGFKDTELGYW